MFLETSYYVGQIENLVNRMRVHFKFQPLLMVIAHRLSQFPRYCTFNLRIRDMAYFSSARKFIIIINNYSKKPVGHTY